MDQKTAATNPVSSLINEAMSGRLDRRTVIQRATALGLSAPVLAAMLRFAPGAAAQGTPDASPAAGPAPTGDPVVIGCVYNLTGDYASLDNPARDGSELAAAELSQAGGILGRPVQLQIYDGKSDLTEVSNVTKRLVEEDEVPIVTGLTDTSYVLAAAAITQPAGVPFLDVGGTAPIITSVGDMVFMVPFGDNVQAAVAAEYAGEQGYKTCALLFDEGSDYTRFLAQYFRDRFTAEDIGGEIVAESTYGTDDTDYSAQLTEFANLDPAPDFLFFSSGPSEIGTIVKQARDSGLTQQIIGGDGYDTPQLIELAGDAAEGIVFTTHEGIYGDSPKGAEFVEAYEAQFGKAPDNVFAALGYDAIRLIADAVNRAESLEGEAIRDALSATDGYEAVTGSISYPEGQRIPQKSVALIEVEDGAFNLLEFTVPDQVPDAGV